MTRQRAPSDVRRAASGATAKRAVRPRAAHLRPGCAPCLLLLVLVGGCTPSVKDMMLIGPGRFQHVRLFTEENISDAMPGLRIDMTEVSVKQYQACVDSGACEPAGTGEDCNFGRSGRLLHPINCVSWDEAKAYCSWLGRRLPTADEWEYAGRARGGPEDYPWGDEPPGAELLNACGSECSDDPDRRMYPADDGARTTAPCGSYPKGRNRIGLHDMGGNVREWTATMVPQKSAGAAGSSADDDSEESYVVRGGSFKDWDQWFAQPRLWRPEYRSSRLPDLGFRCARSLR